MSYNRNYVLENINEDFGELFDIENEEINYEKLKKLSQNQLIELVNELYNYI
jgi:hypothetical protein